jgi:hypothetical protein
MLRSISPEDACRRYLKFAVRHRHEYGLLMSRVGKVKTADGRRGPVFDAVQKRLAQVFGGAPEAYERAALQMWCLVHGAASLLIARGENSPEAKEIREACRLACQNIVEFEVSSQRAQPH